MYYRSILRVLGFYLGILALVLIIPTFVAFYFEYFADPLTHPQPHSTIAFAWTILVTVLLSTICFLCGRHAKGQLYKRESILLVVVVWIMTVCIGALPFVFSKTLTNPVDAVFESMSGFTTTGSSVFYPKSYDQKSGKETAITLTLPELSTRSYTFYGTITPVRNPLTGAIILEGYDAVGRGILFWRSFTQWLGGLGIIFLFIAIFPLLLIGGKFMVEAELPGPYQGSFRSTLVPRLKETASLLWKLYLGFTIIQGILLLGTNPKLPVFDAVTISLSSISTGGFSIHNGSIGYYDNAWTESIVMVFMLLGSINFALYFFLLRGKIFKIYEPEFFLFIVTVILGCRLVTWNIWDIKTTFADYFPHYDFLAALRFGAFQAISSLSCTGFNTVNYDYWPFGVQAMMLVLMYLGGMSGSTTGGLKSARHLILFRSARHKIESLFRPDTIRCLKVGDREVPMKTSLTTYTMFWIVISLSVLGTVCLLMNGIGFETAIGLIGCSINNTGLSFRFAGPTGTCAFLPVFSKFISMIWMLLGRLECFALLIVLTPAFWRSR